MDHASVTAVELEEGIDVPQELEDRCTQEWEDHEAQKPIPHYEKETEAIHDPGKPILGFSGCSGLET